MAAPWAVEEDNERLRWRLARPAATGGGGGPKGGVEETEEGVLLYDNHQRLDMRPQVTNSRSRRGEAGPTLRRYVRARHASCGNEALRCRGFGPDKDEL